MEGPSLFLAAEQLSPFVGMEIISVNGNSKIGIERLIDQKILSIFSCGKQLFFQFESFALRVHFLLYGTFEATICEKKVTGDYPKKTKTPRLAFELKNGHAEMYYCSVKFIEHSNVRETCDFTADIMSKTWNEEIALKKIKECSECEIADVLLDQSIFAGVGNIIKNEVLLRAKISPLKKVKELSSSKLQRVLIITRKYVLQFYKWRKKFVLRKHYRIYRQSYCKACGSKVIRKKTGMRKRISFICPSCQK